MRFGIGHRKRDQVILLSPSSIFPNPAQPRTVFDQEELDKLAESIRHNGLLQPITVRPLGLGRYELISGERRLKACKQLGLDKVRALILDVDDRQSAILAMIENLQREDLNFFDEARGIYELIEHWGVTQEDAAVKLGMAQSTLANKLRLLRLPVDVQEAICENGLTERHARALLRLIDTDLQKEAIAVIARKRLNVAQTDRYIETLLQGQKVQPKRLLIVKDLRIFMKTINHAIDRMREAGIEAEVEQSEEQEYIQYKVKIPKTSAYQQRRTSMTP